LAETGLQRLRNLFMPTIRRLSLRFKVFSPLFFRFVFGYTPLRFHSVSFPFHKTPTSLHCVTKLQDTHTHTCTEQQQQQRQHRRGKGGKYLSLITAKQSKYCKTYTCMHSALDTPQKSWGTFSLTLLHMHIRVWLYFPWFLFFPFAPIFVCAIKKIGRVSATFSRAFHSVLRAAFHAHFHDLRRSLLPNVRQPFCIYFY